MSPDFSLTHQTVSAIHGWKARHREATWWVTLVMAPVLIFSMWPGIDTWFSALFYAGGGWFPANDTTFARAVTREVPRVGGLLIAGAVALILLGWAWPRAVARHHRRRAVMLVLCAALGVGLVVHEMLKNSWGRPRPRAMQMFGGTATFVPVLEHSRQCQRNCSFVSGHAAGGFVLMSLGMLGTVQTRRRWSGIGLAAGLGIGFVRVIQGAHFLSDVLLGAFFVWASCWLVREAWLHYRLRRRRRRVKHRPAPAPS